VQAKVPIVSDLLAKVRAELELRLHELRPLVSEYERTLDAASALGIGPERASAPSQSKAATHAAQRDGGGKPQRARRGAAEHAIVAALEHGSHTVSELVVVTAMSGPNIRSNLRRLLKARMVTQTNREGKAAYALSSPSD
jgi:DNA-binding transcriptional ArsR family regulator